MIGAIVGRYRVMAKLGQGGMGSVWKAEDTLLARTVALKVLPESLADSPPARRRFLHEARAASVLDHPGVARVYDAGEADGRLYIACSYVEGQNISDRAARAPMPVPEAIRIAIAAAEALAHAHTHGVIHRDVTGRNILLANDGRVVVVDFGIALRSGTSRLTPTDAVCGTIAYMAPEVIQGGEADRRADIYGLGVVLYEMLTGSLPHESERLEALMYSVVHRVPDSPSARRTGIPAELDQVTLKAMAKDPVQRHRSADELADALRAIGPADPAAVRLPGPPRARAADGWARATLVREGAAGSLPEAICIAVLPFRDVSTLSAASRQGELLAHGLAETVSGSLAGYAGIQVVPPLAALQLRGREGMDIREVARQLGVNLVLCGTLERSGSRVRVTYSLLNPVQKLQIAGDVIDGTASRLLAVEDRLVERVARALGLEEGSAARAGRMSTRDPAAHEHYLQALGYLMRYENEASVSGAISLLEGLLATDGENAVLQAMLGRAYHFKFRLTYEKSWEEKAAACCERAVSLDPGSPEVLVTLGELHRVAGRHTQSVRTFRKALKLRADDAEALLGLAGGYEGLARFEDAERAIRQAIALRPNYWGGHIKLGLFFYNRGQYERALEPWRRVAELTPDNPRGHANLGAAYYRLGRYEEAMAAYRRSIEIQPNASAYANVGTLHFYLGNHHEAAAMFEKGAALRPYNPRMWGDLADAYRWIPGCEAKAAAAYDQAITLVQEQLEVSPNNSRALSEAALWLAKRGRPREAARALRRATAVRSPDVNSMPLLVIACELLGDRQKALEWLGRAVRGGYDTNEFEREPELASLRQDPEFRRVLKGGRANLQGRDIPTHASIRTRPRG